MRCEAACAIALCTQIFKCLKLNNINDEVGWGGGRGLITVGTPENGLVAGGFKIHLNSWVDQRIENHLERW